jgi:hypothetical protein
MKKGELAQLRAELAQIRSENAKLEKASPKVTTDGGTLIALNAEASRKAKGIPYVAVRFNAASKAEMTPEQTELCSALKKITWGASGGGGFRYSGKLHSWTGREDMLPKGVEVNSTIEAIKATLR